MIFATKSSIQKALIDMPETGMGYQFIEAQLGSNLSTERLIIYNSELIIQFDGFFNENRQKVILSGYDKTLKLSREVEMRMIKPLPASLLHKDQSDKLSPSSLKGRHTGNPAIINPITNANGIESFVRLSAFEDDKRIDFLNRKLKKGSYTTTETDYKSCKVHNDDPVDRYALPNNDNVKWAFYITPTTSDRLQRGVVQPAFEKIGGGIEAFFKNGTSDGTFIRKTAY